MLSAATDGRVAVWDMSKALLAPNTCEKGDGSGVETAEHCTGDGSTQPLVVCQAHQSGINDIAIQKGSTLFYCCSACTVFHSFHSQRGNLLCFHCGG